MSVKCIRVVLNEKVWWVNGQGSFRLLRGCFVLRPFWRGPFSLASGDPTKLLVSWLCNSTWRSRRFCCDVARRAPARAHVTAGSREDARIMDVVSADCHQSVILTSNQSSALTTLDQLTNMSKARYYDRLMHVRAVITGNFCADSLSLHS